MFFVMSRGDRLWYYYLKKIFTPPYLRFSRATYRAVTKTYPCPVVVQYRTLLQSRSSAMIPTADKDYLPLFVEGKVVKGFGRGSKQLGIPTGIVCVTVRESLSFRCGGTPHTVMKASFLGRLGPAVFSSQ